MVVVVVVVVVLELVVVPALLLVVLVLAPLVFMLVLVLVFDPDEPLIVDSSNQVGATYLQSQLIHWLFFHSNPPGHLLHCPLIKV